MNMKWQCQQASIKHKHLPRKCQTLRRRLPSIKRESEKNEKEENGANTNKDLKTRKHLNRNHRVAVSRDGGLIIETAGLATQRSTSDAEGQLYD